MYKFICISFEELYHVLVLFASLSALIVFSSKSEKAHRSGSLCLNSIIRFLGSFLRGLALSEEYRWSILAIFY